MGTIIRNRQIENDSWRLLDSATDGGFAAVPEAADLIVPLGLWLTNRPELIVRPGRIGLWLRGDDEPAPIAEDLKNFGVIAVRFPHFTDGRGYSLGRLLRERYGWRGELRAIGDILRDQLFYLARAGFDAFALRDGEDPLAALDAFDTFGNAYQAAADQPLPLFRRRLMHARGGVERS